MIIKYILRGHNSNIQMHLPFAFLLRETIEKVSITQLGCQINLKALPLPALDKSWCTLL